MLSGLLMSEDTEVVEPETGILPLDVWHRARGARMVEFAGYWMPIQYEGIVAEHEWTRTSAGLFDVSHMGQIELAGPDALATVQWISSNDASRLAIGQIQCSALTTPEGTFVDDILVYRMADQHYLWSLMPATS